MTTNAEPARTPDDHLATLVQLAEEYERVGPVLGPQLRPKYLQRAAAIRWLLALTAYPIEEHTAE